MKKRRHVERESRHSRSKQFGREENDLQDSLGTRGILVTSAMQESRIDTMRGESGHSERPKSSSRLPQDDYVQRWLLQMTQEIDMPSKARLGSRKENVSRPVGPGGLSRGFDFEQFPQVNDYDPKKEHASAQGKHRKRMLDSSSDCSFLECALALDPRPETLHKHNMVEGIEMREESKTRRQRRKLERSVGLEGSVVSLSINQRVESFEKRKRHKTCEDRYEPKMALVDSKSQVNREKQGQKKRKPKSRLKVPRAAGEDLMHQFSSKSVGLDRLTMRPSHTVGLFKNGRASSPGRRRGYKQGVSGYLSPTNIASTVPDLAFSEMDFLRHSKQRPVAMEEKKSLSKSRESEKRRSERAQNEISEYFKPSFKVNVEVEGADEQQASCTSTGNHKLRRGEIGKHRYQSCYSKSTSRSIDLSKEPLLELDRRHAFKQLAAMPHLRGQTVQPSVAPDVNTKLSDTDTTYFTWSDSARSPEISQCKQKTCYVVSSTPESIRQMLTDTGIFRNTGINKTTGRTYEAALNEPVRSQVPTQASGLSKIPNCESPTSHMRKSFRTNIQTPRPVEVGVSALRTHCSPHEIQIRHLYENGSRAKEGGEVLRLAKPIIQHCSTESRWEEHNTDRKDMTNFHLSKPKAPQEIAQDAYVKPALMANTAIHGVGVDTNNNTISDGAPDAETVMPQQPTEQVMYEESSAEPADHCLLLDCGAKKLEGHNCSTGTDNAKSLGDPLSHHEYLIQSSKAAIPDLPAERQVDSVQAADGLPDPSRTTETIIDLSITNEGADDGINQIGGSKFTGNIYEATHEPIFEGLPTRGLWPSRASRPISSSHAVFTPLAIEPLYSHQLENRISLGLADAGHNQNVHMDQVLHRLDTPLVEYSHIEDGDLCVILDDEYQLVNGTENLQEYDLMFSNELDSVPNIGDGEEEHTPWELRYHDILHQTTTHQDAYERARFGGSFNQQQLSVIYANPDREDRHYHTSHELLRELVRGKNGSKHHALNGFWQPRRQY